MKRWIITLNLLFYITILNQWNFAESQTVNGDSTTPDSDGSTPVNSVDPTVTSAGQASQSPITESQPKSSSSATDQSSTEGTPTDTTLTNPVTSVTKVTLDLNATQSTTQFDYTDENGLVTFTPKDDHVFSKVTKGTKDVWKSKNNVNGTLVRTKTVDNKKYLAILLTNNMFKLLKEENNEWNDITSERYDISKLKFLGDNDTELKSSDYTVILIYLSYQYTFKPGINCTNIKYGEDDVWKHSEETKFSKIKIFSLGLITNSFFVFNNEFESKKLDFKPTPEPEAKPETPEPTPTTPDETKPTDSEHPTKSVEPPLEPTQSTEESSTHQSTQQETPPTEDSKPTIFEETQDSKPTIPEETTTENTPTPQRGTPHGGTTPPGTHPTGSGTGTVSGTPPGSPTGGTGTPTTPVGTTTGTPIALNISNTKDTTQFDYTKDESGVITYTPKSNYVFNKVVKKPLIGSTKIIWSASPNVYTTLARIKTLDNEKFLALLLTNNSFVLFHSSDKRKNWNDLTSQRYDVTKLKFLDEKDNELTASDYEVTLVNLSYQHKFNDGVNCKNITYNDITIWTHTDDPEFQSIKSLHLDLPTNKFSVINSSDQSKELKDITMVTLDIDKTQSTNEFSHTDQNGVITYTPKSSHVFSKVSQGNTVIWQSKNNLYATLVVTNIYDVEKYLALFLTNNMFKLFKEQSDGTFEDITSNRLDFMKLKFFGGNDTPLTKTDYTVSMADLSYTYKFNTGVNCRKITYYDKTLWTHTDDPEFSSIKSLQLDLTKDQFSVTNSSYQTKELTKPLTKVTLDIQKTQSTSEFSHTDQNDVITFTTKSGCVFSKVTQGTNVIWVSKDGLYSSLVMSKTVYGVKFLAMLLTNNMFILFKGSDDWHDVTSKRRDITKLKFLDESDTQLTKTDYSVRTVFLSFIYTFNDDVICKKIKLGDDEVWKYSDDPDYSEIKIFSIGLVSNSFYVFNNKNKSKKLDIKVSLDINASQSTDKFDISEHNSILTYRPKSGYKLTKVCDGTKEIWQSDTGNECPTEVRIGSSDDAKYLALLLGDGTFKFFEKESDDWTEISDDNLLREHIPNFPAKSQTQTSSTTTETIGTPATTTLTKVTLDAQKTESTDYFDFNDQNGLITFKPKANHVFSKVVDGTKDIWKSKDNIYGRLVMSMTKDDGKHLVILLTDNMFRLFHEGKTMSGPSPVSSMSRSSNSSMKTMLRLSRLITK